MADIVNPQVVRFANERVRVSADALLTAYDSAKVFVQEWTAGGYDTLIPNTPDNVADGSDVDGRRRVTGARVQQYKTFLDAFITAMESGSPRRIDVVRAISVNGASRF